MAACEVQESIASGPGGLSRLLLVPEPRMCGAVCSALHAGPYLATSEQLLSQLRAGDEGLQPQPQALCQPRDHVQGPDDKVLVALGSRDAAVGLAGRHVGGDDALAALEGCHREALEGGACSAYVVSIAQLKCKRWIWVQA